MKSTPTSQTTQKQETSTVIRVVDQKKYIKIYNLNQNYGNGRSINWGFTANPINADLSQHISKYPNLLDTIVPCLIDEIKHYISEIETSIVDESTQIEEIVNDMNLLDRIQTTHELDSFKLSVSTARFFHLPVIRSSYQRQLTTTGTATFLNYGSKSKEGITQMNEIEYIKHVGGNYCSNRVENLQRSVKHSRTTLNSLKRLLDHKFELLQITKITDTTVSIYENPI